MWIPLDLDCWNVNKVVIYKGMGSGFTRYQLNILSIGMPAFADQVRKAMEAASEQYVSARRKALQTSAGAANRDATYFEDELKSKETKESLRKLRQHRRAWARKTFLEDKCTCSCSCSAEGAEAGSDDSKSSASHLALTK